MTVPLARACLIALRETPMSRSWSIEATQCWAVKRWSTLTVDHNPHGCCDKPGTEIACSVGIPGPKTDLNPREPLNSGGAELAVAGVAQSGDDEGGGVEVLVDGGGDDVDVEAGVAQPVDASGAQRAHTAVIGSASRSISSSIVCTSDPPVASIGSTTITGRPANDSGSLLTYGFGANVSSSRLIPMNPTSAAGSSSWAACTNPSPRRRIGTTTGCTARRRRRRRQRRLDGRVERRQVLRRPRHQQRADALEVLAEQRVRRRSIADLGKRGRPPAGGRPM